MIKRYYFQILGLNNLIGRTKPCEEAARFAYEEKVPNLDEDDDNQLFFDDSE